MAGRNHDRQSSGGGIWKIAFVAILGSLIGQIDATIVNISLPELVNRLDSELATIQWVISGYLLALALALPLSGWLVDRVGGRRTYLICFPAFTGASILCACAWSDLSLIAFRIIQGVSGGVLAPMTQIMMARAAGNRLPQVMGYAAMPILVAPILGPVIAGGVLEHLSWRWLFLITVPFGILATIMAWLVLPDDRGDIRRTPFDFLGFSLLAPGITVLLYSLSAAAWRLLPLALVLLAGFVLTALRRRKVSIINLELFGNRDFFASVAIQFFSNATSFAGQMLIPLFLIEAGFSESETGLFIAPIGVGMLLGYPMLGFLTKRFGIRWVSTTGALLAACATVPLIIMALQGVNQFLLIAALFLRGA